MSEKWWGVCTVLVGITWVGSASAQDPSTLRLVPFPKEIQLEKGAFALDQELTLEAPAEAVEQLGGMIVKELQRAGSPARVQLRPVQNEASRLRLSAKPGGPVPTLTLRQKPTDEDYALQIRPEAILCSAPAKAGLFYGVQTLCQLIRANRRDGGLPCLSVRDWPSLRWRCFQDDLTRGPSSKLDTLKLQVDLGAQLKMNLMTYYMEYQYHFKKHPIIGPENGSLEPEDLQAWVAYAKARQMDVLGNQQSFGHFQDILKHERYAHLREKSYILCPVTEGSYQLLDDLYSEVCPLLPFPWFNVCCDETYELGDGPSKELAKKIGVGGVYVRHIRRVHDLLKDKYNKRMMMWGDIILKHPDKLDQIPKDTIMLTWGYSARESFEDQIIPFARSGYEFFVCPGISNWSRILPDFGAATTNIRHFVRDGAKHGALGMLNTAWEDDGDALQGYKWHGNAWGAECAWNASTTTPELFNRRVGAVLFGESGDHFGRAIELLAKTHRLPGMLGMNNKRFWQNDFTPAGTPQNIRDSAGRLLEIVRPAIEHLEACQQDATVNSELLDYFIFGARRMELIGQRMLDGLEAAQCYTEACEGPPGKAAELLTKVEQLVRNNREAHARLARRFEKLWLAESKPYALDWTLKRYAKMIKRFDELLAGVAEARKKLDAAAPLPRDLGLALPEAFSRRTRPHKTLNTPLEPDAPWAKTTASHRLGLVVGAGSVDRHDLPVVLDVSIPAELASKPVGGFGLVGDGPPRAIPVQLDPSEKPNKTRLTFLLPGRISQGSRVAVHVYLGLSGPAEPLPQAVTTADAPEGMKWINNDKVQLLLGPEGGHVYQWAVKKLKNRDLTMPGQSDWAGFCDMGGPYRNAPHKLVCTARGPAMTSYRCREALGPVKTINLFAGTSWIEVVLNYPVQYYWEFDDPKNFSADGPTPGEYLFSNGSTGVVGRQADGVPAQVKAEGVHWGVKFNHEGLALGIITPEVAANHVIAPGAGAGGVGIERSPPACHFITYAGLLDAEPEEVMRQLRHTLDFTNQPEVILHAIQARR